MNGSNAFLTAITGVLVLSALASGAAARTDVLVGMDDETASVAYLRYYAETVVVEAGETVAWVANSATPHTVTSDAVEDFDSSPELDDMPEMAAWFGPGGFLMPGQAFNQTFAAAGRIAYFCKIHPGMTGTVTVVVPPPQLPGGEYTPKTVHVQVGGGSGDTTVDRFWPAHARVFVGDTVVWTNVHSAEPHTVTAANGAFDSSPQVGPPPEAFEESVLMEGGARTRYEYTFSEAGTYRYFCKLHPGMWGAVVVLPTGADAESSPGIGGPLTVGLLALVGLLLARRR